MKKLNAQIQQVYYKFDDLLRDPNHKNAHDTFQAFLELRQTLGLFVSFAKHTWEVQLYTPESSVTIKIQAEHVEEAREMAIQLVDKISEVVRYELYCDGILIPEDS